MGSLRRDGRITSPGNASGVGAVRDLVAAWARERALVRIAAIDGRGRGRYTLLVQPGRTRSTIVPDPPCAGDAFDPSNPRCAGECDFTHPDPDNRACCAMWEKCRVPWYEYCETNDVVLDGDTFWLPLGSAHGLFDRPTGIVRLTEPEPPTPTEDLQPRRWREIKLWLLQLETYRSRWTISDARAHDLGFVRDHVRTVELYPPGQCR